LNLLEIIFIPSIAGFETTSLQNSDYMLRLFQVNDNPVGLLVMKFNLFDILFKSDSWHILTNIFMMQHNFSMEQPQ